jgi:hypothetical protein
MPTRTPGSLTHRSHLGLAKRFCRRLASAPLSEFLRVLGDALLERGDVCVELRLVRRSQRSAKLVTLRGEQLLGLLALAGGLLPKLLESRGVTALTRVTCRLKLWLRLLAQGFHLRRVLRPNRFEVRFFRVAQCDAFEQLTAKTASTFHSVRAVGTHDMITMHVLRRGRLLCRSERSATDRNRRCSQR